MNSNAPTPTESNSIISQHRRCATALTRWLENSEDFREGYEELREVSLHLPWGTSLPEFEEDKPTLELLDLIEGTLLEMLEQASSRLLPEEFGADWELELFGALKREYLPLTSLEGDHYGPEK